MLLHVRNKHMKTDFWALFMPGTILKWFTWSSALNSRYSSLPLLSCTTAEDTGGPTKPKYLLSPALYRTSLLNLSLKDKALEKARLVKKISRLTELCCPKWFPPAICGYSTLHFKLNRSSPATFQCS